MRLFTVALTAAAALAAAPTTRKPEERSHPVPTRPR